MNRVAAVVLAAGVGKRMKSARPKVLHRVAGRPLVVHVLSAVGELGLERCVLVVAPGAKAEIDEELAAASLDIEVTFALQKTPRGTADSARAGLASLVDFDGEVLVLPGDAPLIAAGTLQRLLKARRDARDAATLLTARVHDPVGYGRVIRGSSGEVSSIVEERDASDAERAVNEVNSSVYAFDSRRLAPLLDKLESHNAQGEYYLTDVIELLVAAGERVGALVADPLEIEGVNSRAQLAHVAAALRRRICDRLMESGVTILDPAVTYIDATVTVERDAIIHPFTYLEGSTTVGEGAEVGPQTRVVDSHIAAGATVTFAVVRSSDIGEEASVGPYASLRPGTKLGRGAHLGTFVEAKNSSLGESSKANHLAYLGDATIGKGVNIGAGTITCNWDGEGKNPTVIEDDVYVSSDTMLVAPVRLGARSATGAGAVVRGDVPADALAVGVPARIIEGKGNRMRRDEPEASDNGGGQR